MSNAGCEAAKRAYLDKLAQVFGQESADDFQVELECIERRYFRDLEQRVRDAEAAQLLYLGVERVAERQHCHRSTVYRRASRGKVVARHGAAATNPV